MRPPSFLPLVDDYLAVRRGLGFSLEAPAWLLYDFARYADRLGHRGPLTTELAVRWALSSRSGDPAQAARRLAAVRQLMRFRALLEPATEVPPAGLLGRVPHRRRAHIYSEAELAALLEQASRLLPRRGLRPRTYVAFFSLLAATGLRLSEACRLERGDVDLDAGVLTIREGKFRKARLVPLHPSATEALTRYAAERDRCRGTGEPGRFFRTERVPALTAAAVRRRSAGSGSGWAGARRGGQAGRASTTCATPSPSAGCFAGTRRAPTLSASCSPSRPTSATPRSATPTGT